MKHVVAVRGDYYKDLEKNIGQLAVEEEAYISREELLEVVESLTEVEPFILQLESIITMILKRNSPIQNPKKYGKIFLRLNRQHLRSSQMV